MAFETTVGCCPLHLDSGAVRSEKTYLNFVIDFTAIILFLVLQAMDLVGTCGISKELLLGNAGHQWCLRFDTAFMILLRYLAFPARLAIASTNSTCPDCLLFDFAKHFTA